MLLVCTGLVLLVTQKDSSAGTTGWVAPAAAASKTNPVPPDAKSRALGKKLFETACVACHGPKGEGNGPAASALERNGAPVHPGDLSSPKMRQETDGELFWKISQGRSPMPAWGQAIPEDQIWAIIDYVRTLAPKPAEGKSDH